MISRTPDPRAPRAIDVRGLVIAAAQALARQYPLHRFIARSPYAGYEESAWDAARLRIGAEHGVDLTRPEPEFRALHRAGQINDADLLDALDGLVHDVALDRILSWGGQGIAVRDILLCDLLHSPPVTPPTQTLRTLGAQRAPHLQARIDEYVSRTVASLAGHAPAPSPLRDGAFWESWRRVAGRDLSLPARVRRGIRALPSTPEETIARALEHGELVGDAAVAFLRAHLLAQPGWAATIADGSTALGVTLTDYVAVRVALEQLWLPPGTPSWQPDHAASGADDERHAARVAAVETALAVALTPTERAQLSRVLLALPEPTRIEAWQSAFERHLALAIAPRTRVEAAVTARPPAQVVLCIDPRSEGLRRHLESVSDIETLGFAGFFALALAVHDAAGSAAVASCPVLVAPRAAVHESSADRGALERYRAGVESLHAADSVVEGVAESPAAPYAYAEMAGWLTGPAGFARTVAPVASSRIATAWQRSIAPIPATRLDPDVAFALDERVVYAESALRMMGLVDGFARLVVLCGHGATVANNPFAASLQCGACGGHEGAPNARAAAAIFNDPETRQALMVRGIRIPSDTIFVAAQHDTVTDHVRLLEPWAIPASHAGDLEALTAALQVARLGNARERLRELPGTARELSDAQVIAETERRAADWAQVYPEWGLCGNVAMIIGPRRITAGRDLGRRVFLHSYEASADPDGSALETILTAPMIVAQWINAQYSASTLAPDRFGAGSKTLHNVVGEVGVLSGYGGDLRSGLPWQSVGVGVAPRHEPVRLQVFVQAPLEVVGQIVSRSHVVRHLVEGRWIALRARADESTDWSLLTRYGWRSQPLADAAASDPRTQELNSWS